MPQLSADMQRRLARNRSLRSELAMAMLRTNLLQGSDLQSFLDRVVAAGDDRPDPAAPPLAAGGEPTAAEGRERERHGDGDFAGVPIVLAI